MGDVLTYIASDFVQRQRHRHLYLVGHETLGAWDGAVWVYHLPDGLGSVRQEVDGAGAVVSSREWTPYGVEVGAAQAGPGYTGEWFDADVGLVYLRARWYGPEVGGFTRGDEWGGDHWRPLTLNSYLYVLANPVNATDPGGRSPFGAFCSQDGCSPNDEAATRWLLEAMRTNAVSPKARTIRRLNMLALAGAVVPVPILLPPIPPLPPVIVAPCPVLAIPPKALAYLLNNPGHGCW